MIKLIIADLDNVIIDSAKLHDECLFDAIKHFYPDFSLNESQLTNLLNHTTTKRKLNALNIDQDKIEPIYQLKKEKVKQEIKNYIKFDQKVYDLFIKAKEKYQVGVVTNTGRDFLIQALNILRINDLVDLYLGQEDVVALKPYPAGYLQCMQKLDFSPKETVIVEDSTTGKEAAYLSGAHVIGVNSPEDLTEKLLFDEIERIDKPIPHIDSTLTVVVFPDINAQGVNIQSNFITDMNADQSQLENQHPVLVLRNDNSGQTDFRILDKYSAMKYDLVIHHDWFWWRRGEQMIHYFNTTKSLKSACAKAQQDGLKIKGTENA